MIDKRVLMKHFGRNAGNYDQYASVQRVMAQKLIELLQARSRTNPSFGGGNLRILEIGCGTGYLTGKLVKHFPAAHISAIDIAPEMIIHAKSRFDPERVLFICNDIEEIELESKYDLIISNATFQWLNRPAITIGKLYKALTPHGTLGFSTFGPKTFSELYQAYKIAAQTLGSKDLKPLGQKFYDLEELYRLCNQELPLEKVEITGKEVSEYEFYDTSREFLSAVKKIGANNSNRERNRHDPKLMREMLKIYDTEFHMADKVRVTYHCLYLMIKSLA